MHVRGICVCVESICVACVYVLHVSDYIGELEIIDDHRAGKIVVELRGRLNKFGVVSPRFDVKGKAIESWVSSLLPSRLVGQICLLMHVDMLRVIDSSIPHSAPD